MASTYYNTALNMDARYSPFGSDTVTGIPIDDVTDENGNKSTQNSLTFLSVDGGLMGPASIINNNVAVNYRTIYNGMAAPGENVEYTLYDDYKRLIEGSVKYGEILQDIKNPTYSNIIKWYNDPIIDPYGLATYKIQDFIYLKYYNQIPNNYMITLRRYTQPCMDWMFGLDMPYETLMNFQSHPEVYFSLATAVTYMGEKTGNKLSDILKFDYGMEWEEKTGEIESLRNADGGLAAQIKANDEQIAGRAKMTGKQRAAMIFRTGGQVKEAFSRGQMPDGDLFAQRYGANFYGDLNVVNKVKLRSRGLNFTNSFSLNFEYSLKSLKCVNPRVAMLDILSNFLILTGNYGDFWGGATIFYGQHSIAPQFGDPDKLRMGDYKGYVKSIFSSIKDSFSALSDGKAVGEGGLKAAFGNLLSGSLESMLGPLFGGKIGTTGQANVTKALLSGEPSGFWHVTVGNPLDPIAMMGNMAISKTSVTFGDALGYDDFPTEVKFTVELEHARPRDNAGIQAMFNAGRGRFYAFTNSDIEKAYHNVDALSGFKRPSTNQETNTDYDLNSWTYSYTPKDSGQGDMSPRMRQIGGNIGH